MSTIHFKFVPHIQYERVYEDIIDGIAEEIVEEDVDKIYPTGNPQIDELVLPGLLNDRIKFRDIVVYSQPNWQFFRHEFNTDDNLIHIWVQNVNDLQELSNVLYFLDPEGGAADSWMEGDIQASIDYAAYERLRIAYIHLVPIISYIGSSISQEDVEQEIDRATLPESQ